LASPWTRIEEPIVELVLFVCTLGVGWLLWWIVAWSKGDTPAKQVLALRVVDDDGQLAGFGRMATREVIGRAMPLFVAIGGLVLASRGVALGGLAVGAAATYFVIGVGFLWADDKRQAPWDKLAGTVVVAPGRGAPPKSPASAPAPVGNALP
jgi:uncharacterized RDD family membrane protein YckC